MNGALRRVVLGAALATLAAVIPTVVTARRAMGPCDSSGMYTDRLCAQDHMNPGTYILSPSDHFRMYYQADGSARVYDISNWENWIERCTLVPAYGNPGYLLYGISNPPPGVAVMSLLANDGANGFVASGFAFSPPDGIRMACPMASTSCVSKTTDASASRSGRRTLDWLRLPVTTPAAESAR